MQIKTTRQMELNKCIMLSEISQRKTNTIWFHSYVELRKKKNQQQMNIGEGGKKGEKERQTIRDSQP